MLRLAFAVRDLIDATAAAPGPACESCTEVGAAFQTVLVATDPGTVPPGERCPLCDMLASVVRGVVGPAEPVRFTDEGNRRLAEGRLRVAQLRIAELTEEQLVAELAALTAELGQVVSSELEPATVRLP